MGEIMILFQKNSIYNLFLKKCRRQQIFWSGTWNESVTSIQAMDAAMDTAMVTTMIATAMNQTTMNQGSTNAVWSNHWMNSMDGRSSMIGCNNWMRADVAGSGKGQSQEG